MCSQMAEISLFFAFGRATLIFNMLSLSTELMHIFRYMVKSGKAMGELLKRVSHKCKNNDIEKKLK